MSKGVTFCRTCRRHFESDRCICPVDGARLIVPTIELPGYGTVVDRRYLLMERIGTGGMGAVYRSYDMAGRMEVALKVISPTMAAREDGVERFFREVRAIRRLNHPNVVAVHGFGRTNDGLLYLVMELLAGECLSRLLAREERLSIPRALGVIEQVAAALEAAHQQSVVHRDLKPENFRLLPGNLLKILDFGIASLLDSKAPPTDADGKHVCGTPAYMSPEHALGFPCEPRSDLYGPGVLLYELIAGSPPYTGDEPLAIIRAQVSQPIPSLRDAAGVDEVPDELEALVRSLLGKEPGDRPESAAEVRQRLRDIRGCSSGAELRADEEEP